MGLIYAEQIEHMSVDQMQETHESEIKLLNEVGKLATKYEMKRIELSELEPKLNQYIAHVKKHFASEEELMLKYNFPSYEMHKSALDMFLLDLDSAVKEWKNHGSMKKILHFIQKTPEWIIIHVNTVDAPTANFLAQKM